MLLDMLTADAAARHGNSPSHPEASPTLNGSFLAHTPLALLGSYLRRQTPSPSLNATTARDADSTTDTPNTPNTPETPTAQGNAMTHDDHVVSYAPSRPVSSGSSAADDRSRKRAPRLKTSYLIAKPVQPVNHRSKLYIRPKVLLQLHQVIAAQRPKPVYEVIPFSLLPQRSTRRLARAFNTKERLGPHDLLIVEAEAYSSKEEEKKSEDERWALRTVIGVICPGKTEKGVTGMPEICMNDGQSRWEVTATPNGGYEFNTTDQHGLTLKARWVLKPAHLRRVSGMSSGELSPSLPPGQEDKKFTFSTISANSRRHPIIATMTRTRIDVMDSYAIPSATSPPTPGLTSFPSPALTPSSISMSSFMDDSGSKPIVTDDALRRFIVVSGLWVASQQLCSSDASSQSPISLQTSSASLRPSVNRAVSMSFLDSPRSTSPASTLDENRGSIPGLFRAAGERLPRRMSFTETSSSPVPTRTESNSSPVLKTRGRRANSAGTATLHSMTGSMRKRHGLAFGDQILVESEEERQGKRSAELLRIKELALPTPVERPSIETTADEVIPTLLLTSLPSPVVISPSSDGGNSPLPWSSPPLSPALLSPMLPDPERTRKTRSSFNPVTTAGMWDSGVTEGPGLKRRPTSMFVMNERKRKQEKCNRSKSEDNRKDEKAKQKDDGDCMGLKRKGDWYKYKFKVHLKNLFKKEKA